MVARGLGDTAETVTGGRRADEGIGFGGEFAHAGLVAEDRPAGPGRRRVDREHGDLVALSDQVQPEVVDQR